LKEKKKGKTRRGKEENTRNCLGHKTRKSYVVISTQKKKGGKKRGIPKTRRNVVGVGRKSTWVGQKNPSGLVKSQREGTRKCGSVRKGGQGGTKKGGKDREVRIDKGIGIAAGREDGGEKVQGVH